MLLTHLSKALVRDRTQAVRGPLGKPVHGAALHQCWKSRQPGAEPGPNGRDCQHHVKVSAALRHEKGVDVMRRRGGQAGRLGARRHLIKDAGKLFLCKEQRDLQACLATSRRQCLARTKRTHRST